MKRKNLIKARMRQNLSQEQLANKLKNIGIPITKATIHRYETGITNKIPLKTLEGLAKVLNIEIIDILEDENKEDTENMFYMAKLLDLLYVIKRKYKESTDEIVLEETDPTEILYGEKIPVKRIELYLDNNSIEIIENIILEIKNV